MLNAGMSVATNGYMLKLAPRENRSMFVAAISGLAGVCGGVAALAAGWFLQWTAGFAWEGFGRTWNNYQLLFAISIVLRVACIPLGRRVREPKSLGTAKLLTELTGVWPLRILLFPVGLYRSMRRNGEK